jgi:hypothetical protein
MSTQFFSFSDDTPFSTEAVLVNASSSHYEEDWPSIPHTHAFTELFYVSEGSGEFLIENQHFSIKKDDLIIVNPHIQHTEISLSASPLSYYTVGVDGISFSFHDQKEFQIFHCRQKHADLLFYFHSLFQELDEKEKYDGIWACASILHLPKKQLREVLKNMYAALKSKGWIYTSFKYGEFEGERNGRYFTDFTTYTFKDFIHDMHGLKIEEHWITGDVRPGRGEEKWLNLLLQKK